MTADVLIIGGGVVGLTAAIAIKGRDPSAAVVVIDKEPRCGIHASGRNSGVLHAGFYYTPDSTKARYSADGNRRMTEWCVERGLPIRRTGKLVVARSEAEHPQLDELLRRAQANGVNLQPVSESDARALEPRVRTVGRALFSPDTATVEPAAVMDSLARHAEDVGVVVRCGTAYRARSATGVETSRGPIDAGFLVNAAGLYADRVARDFGFAAEYRIVPFKGLYLCGGPGAGPLERAVYPVPDLGMPFLGAHFTVTPSGSIRVGPTALPALWRENYGGLAGFSALELGSVARSQAGLFVRDRGFRRHAARELARASRRRLVAEAATLLDGVHARDYRQWGAPGIRAQLLDLRTHALVMDFVLQGDDRSLHVLNAVSPAFTCSFPFADTIADRVEAA